MVEENKGNRNKLSSDPSEVNSYGHIMIQPSAGTAVMALVLASSAFFLVKQLSITNAHRFVFSYLIALIGEFPFKPPTPVTPDTNALGVTLIFPKKCLS